ncbi:hypothetical protein TEA_015519 [Camellia sinensis var. sinensis]|uniref:Aldehyde dehydrogenase domain-containing protein n=1 Tax=Camellia sinensis var. sinensis TaxID=542762 RepID=A0A4S4DYV2_CAMSN|nr:hypothetical protein TEA_015519 [Camellia sinensis var. sinensis]
MKLFLDCPVGQFRSTKKSLKSWRPNRSVLVSTSTEASTKQDCPATQEVVSQVPLTTYEEFKAAVSAAKQAFSLWKNTPVTARQRIMFKLQELIRRDIDKLAMNISTEQGKTLNGAKSDVLCGLEVVEHACGMASLQMGEFVPNASNGIDTYCIREPLGVCAGICPFNFPAMISLWIRLVLTSLVYHTINFSALQSLYSCHLASWKIHAKVDKLDNITCGNTFILKPSEKNPEVYASSPSTWASYELGLLELDWFYRPLITRPDQIGLKENPYDFDRCIARTPTNWVVRFVGQIE